MDQTLTDVRHSLRTLLRAPAFSAIVILILTLGIGATTTIFSVVNTVLISSLPYHDPKNLVMVWERNPALGEPIPGSRVPVAWKNFNAWRTQNQVFQGMEAFDRANFNLTNVEKPEQLLVARATPGFFQLLGVDAQLGRTFAAGEDVAGANRVAMITDGFFESHLGRDPRALNKALTLDGVPYTIVGVLPAKFHLPSLWEGLTEYKPVVWVPLPAVTAQDAPDAMVRRRLLVTARLRPDVTLDQAMADMLRVSGHLTQQDPALNSGWTINLFPLRVEDVAPNVRGALYFLLLTVGFVLLVACANLGNLMLARAAGKRKEMAIRIALGSGRARLIWQMVIESLVLSFIGGVLGLLFVYLGIRVIVALQPGDIHGLERISVSPPVVLFAIGLSVLTGLIFGLVPAWVATSGDVNEALKQSSRNTTGGMGPLLRKLLVVFEVGAALMLTIGASLMIRSFRHVTEISPGFRSENLLTAHISLSAPRYSRPEQQQEFSKRLLERTMTLPGVQSASLADNMPLVGVKLMYFLIEGRSVPDRGKGPAADYAFVTPEFFRTMDVELKSGRLLQPEDVNDNANVVVINESLAHRFFPDENPVGQHIRRISPNAPAVTIVGVVADFHQVGMDKPVRPEIFWPSDRFREMTLVARAGPNALSLAPALQRTVWSIDKDQPVSEVQLMDHLISESVSQRRFNMLLLSVLAVVALVVALVGVYGVISYIISMRSHEIGVRFAMGAVRRQILWLFLQQTLRLVALGVAAGLAAALALQELIASLLFGISATEPWIYISSTLALVIIAMLASVAPAWRAAQSNPAMVLREE
ncbi:MAG: ABC transporter permease [Acidobacteriia bacterium]|nr:ABC transporter permease [Terriglobia bacterium]